ncbi:MAG: hypothetical protein AB1765_01245 [Candidatus Hydrogenedentota bacterium]
MLFQYPINTKNSYIDNYHTAGIIEQIYDSKVELNINEWDSVLLNSADSYMKNLFTIQGNPKHRINQLYPNDIHSCAQGIITFSKLAGLKPEY